MLTDERSLIERIEAGTREEQMHLIHEAMCLLLPKLGWKYGRTTDCEALLAIGTDEACAGAAMMLVPERHKDDWSLVGGAAWQAEVGAALSDAATPALALAAACLKAGGDEG